MTEPSWTQLSLTGEGEVHGYVRDEVMAIDVTQTTNGERVADLHRLGYLPEPVLDPSYGEGGMWTRHRPEDFTGYDLDPAKSPSGQGIDFRDLPHYDNTFGSTLYDPPYKIIGGSSDPSAGGMDERYGVGVRRSRAEQSALILDGAIECARVTAQFLIVKCQDQADGPRGVIWQTTDVVDALADEQWRLKDSLHLLSYRSQPGGTTQHNARRGYSTFLVFVPNARLVHP